MRLQLLVLHKYATTITTLNIRGGLRFFSWLIYFMIAAITILSTAWTNSPTPGHKTQQQIYISQQMIVLAVLMENRLISLWSANKNSEVKLTD